MSDFDFPVDEGGVLDNRGGDASPTDTPRPGQFTAEQEAEMDRFWAETKEPQQRRAPMTTSEPRVQRAPNRESEPKPTRAPLPLSEPSGVRAPHPQSETIYVPGGATGKLLNGWTTAPAPKDPVVELIESTDRMLAMHRERHR